MRVRKFPTAKKLPRTWTKMNTPSKSPGGSAKHKKAPGFRLGCSVGVQKSPGEFTPGDFKFFCFSLIGGSGSVQIAGVIVSAAFKQTFYFVPHAGSLRFSHFDQRGIFQHGGCQH